MDMDKELIYRQLEVRNTRDGMIWQIYHVHSCEEATLLASNATKNGFQSVTLTEECTHEETWPDWRETSKGYMPENKIPLPESGYPFYYCFGGFNFPALPGVAK